MAFTLQRTLAGASARMGSAANRRHVSVVAQAGQINPAIKKDVDKVVDTHKTADLAKKAVFCRCWRSEKFPYCDGAHAKHNKETGDNVGPLIIERSE